jgi:dTDP-glucose pyrophosphorylase/thiamine kinase-like enzyme
MITVERTEESVMNIVNTVIIPTAGTGSRMSDYTKNLNKALLPYKEKPILSHIIDNFPKDTKFIIPTGYMSHQVKDFCEVSYSDRDICFVDISDWTSNKSGTAYTLKHCVELIDGPFWYIPCDTYFDEVVYNTVKDTDCYFVKDVPEDKAHLYTMFKLNNNRIVDKKFKQGTPKDWVAFTGVMYIHNWIDFANNLLKLNSVEVIDLISNGNETNQLASWLDFGNIDTYSDALTKSKKFDFSKTDELIYICNDRVVKWWVDPSIAEKKYRKALVNPSVFPKNCIHMGNFMAYDYVKGTTVYQQNDPSKFEDFLSWLDAKVWIYSMSNIDEHALSFYKTKTLARVKLFLEKYPDLKQVTSVDGIPVKNYKYYLDNLDWDYLSTHNLTGFMHGDLHFDNVIVDDNKFTIIDWRHEFSGLVDKGDIYYDLAKLAGGFILNYSKIKDNDFKFNIDGTNVTLEIPNVEHISFYQENLKKYIDYKGIDYKKVQLLIPIIYWNMSPLHTSPFDIFLWYLGIKLFAEHEKIYKSK